ncbi:MAG: LURP-one-related family protein [Anaerolineae bacterium]
MFRRQRQDQHNDGAESLAAQAAQDANAWRRYQMRQQVFALGNDYFVEDAQGQKVYKIDGKVLRVRDTLVFRDMDGKELCKIQERMLRIRNTMEIEGPGGVHMALVKKALITPLRERWNVEVGNGADLEIQGNILDHEYAIGEGRETIAEVSKKWFRIRDTYGVAIAPGQNDVLILAITVAIDMMAHRRR